MIVTYQLLTDDNTNIQTLFNNIKHVEKENVICHYMISKSTKYIFISMHTYINIDDFYFVRNLPIIKENNYESACIFVNCETTSIVKMSIQEYYCFRFMSGIDNFEKKMFLNISYDMITYDVTIKSFLLQNFHYPIIYFYYDKIIFLINNINNITNKNIMDKIDNNLFF